MRVKRIGANQAGVGTKSYIWNVSPSIIIYAISLECRLELTSAAVTGAISWGCGLTRESALGEVSFNSTTDDDFCLLAALSTFYESSAAQVSGPFRVNKEISAIMIPIQNRTQLYFHVYSSYSSCTAVGEVLVYYDTNQ